MALPYPIPDPSTGQWDPFALKRNLEYLDTNRDPDISTTIARSTTTVTVNATTTETTLFSTTIAAGYLGTTGILRYVLLFDHLNSSGSNRTVTFRGYYGGTKFFELDQSHDSDANRRRGNLLAWLASRGSVTTQFGLANIQASEPLADATEPGVTTAGRITGHSSLAINADAAQTFAITAQHSNVSANITTRAFVSSLEVY